MKAVTNYLRISQVSQAVLLLICGLITPSVATSNGGISNYGNHLSTLVPYILSFCLCIIFLCLAARKIFSLNNQRASLAWLLIVLALLELLVLVSTFPRHISWGYSQLHDYLGIILFTYQFFLSIYLLVKLKTISNILVFIVETAGSMIGLLSILKFIHLLFIGQIIGGFGFGLLLILAFPRLVRVSLDRGSAQPD